MVGPYVSCLARDTASDTTAGRDRPPTDPELEPAARTAIGSRSVSQDDPLAVRVGRTACSGQFVLVEGLPIPQAPDPVNDTTACSGVSSTGNGPRTLGTTM